MQKLYSQKPGARNAVGSVKPAASAKAAAARTAAAKTALLIAALLFLPAAGLFAITGEEVAQNVYNRDTGQTMHSLAELNLIESDGKTSNRLIENWTRDPENGTGASVIAFHKPASVQNTRFLTVENENGSDDQWIYLPGLGRVRRIAASEGDSSFMGTDFTYDDMQTREVDEDSHTILREEQAGGRDCYVVESVPKDPSDSQYSKRIQWIAKDIWVPMKVDFYDQDGKLLKTLTVERLEKVQGIWTTINTTIENHQTGHATELNVQKLVYNEELPDNLFTTNFLRTGRP
ncbi:MAG: outer membrane lipoprotein-sorting protein [Spirochaetaceae bacterium]|nr:outer membrane lipoprotein-sorting protein [Spirochaetaceae bacterium]MCF7952292.1 outer membrane lipoprotein-sorting protein [Spirochaetaceae bacterium]